MGFKRPEVRILSPRLLLPDENQEVFLYLYVRTVPSLFLACHVPVNDVKYLCFYIQERKHQKMTKLEASLLDILKEDCRIPLEKMAVMTGASLEEVASAIEDLENRKKPSQWKTGRLFFVTAP